MTGRAGLLSELLSWRNADGGWGYAPGRRTRLEPTCLSLLACGAGGLTLLERWPTAGGLLLDGASLPANVAFNGLALLALLSTNVVARNPVNDLVRRLLETKGIALEPSEVQRLDTRLRAWPWLDGTFSWVEPTAWCLLALKKWRALRHTREADERIDEAERLLIDRTCESGGWNYGNSLVFNQALPAYVSTTALGLLALQDRAREPAVSKSLDRLAANAASEPSALSVGMAVTALHVLGRPVGSTARVLVNRMRISVELGQVVGVATGLYALGYEEHDCAAFRV